ncbi:MFS transporter [Streptomyces tsukubensis]|uniref:MFS transporter n=1 Tax=Streptomyces tsukubensis TaxID=83656 RepID=A0A1V4A718_9ACTN|nr:MFS transporter [Streptomyces tsukubensis]
MRAGTAADAGAGAGGTAGASRTTVALTLISAVTAIALMNYTTPMLTLPGMIASFGTPLSAQAWLLNGTPLGLAALLLVAGSLADDYGRRRLFLTGTLALGVTTLLGSLATTTLLFTLARAAQGMASAAIITSGLGLIVHAFPPGHTRIRATGIWGACVSGGIALGPLLAGVTAGLGWRAVYVVLGAAALLAAAFVPRVLKESRAPRPGRPDLLGALTLGLASVSLLAALTLGRDGWLRAPVWGLLAATVVLAGAFVLVERRGEAPMLDLGLLRHRGFLAATSGALFTGVAVIGLFSYLAALIQSTLGLGTLGVAWLFVLWAGTGFVVALQARRLAGRVGARHQLALGFVLSAAGVLTMLGALNAGSWPRLVPGLLIAGVGNGLLNAALPQLSVESVEPQRAAMGSGANNTARYIGSSAGVALSIAVATSATGETPAKALAHGADHALLVSAALALLGALVTLALRDRRDPVARR